MPPFLVLKRDGSTLYTTRDLASALYRAETYHFDKCLYVTASQQCLHFAQLFKVIEMAGFDWAKNMRHIPYGMVSLTGDEAARMREIICKAILDRRPKCEFRYYARMLKNVGTPEFRRQIRALTVPDIPYLKDRQAICLQEVYWKDLSD